MNYLAVISSIVALAGVWIGGRLALRTQEKGWQQAESQRWRDLRQSTYGDFLNAVRRYRTFVGRSERCYELATYPDGVRLSPRLDDQGMSHKQMLDAALAQVHLVAKDQRTASAARALAGMARRTLVAKMVFKSKTVPSHVDDKFWDSELDFVNAVRTELGLTHLTEHTYDDPLNDTDCELFHAYQPRA